MDSVTVRPRDRRCSGCSHSSTCMATQGIFNDVDTQHRYRYTQEYIQLALFIG